MSANWLILLDQRAEEDVDAAAEWYAEEGLDLALGFLDSVDAALERIAQFPQVHPEVSSGIRRALTKRFPFCIYYAIDGERVVVFAVLHIRRNSDQWRQRLQ